MSKVIDFNLAKKKIKHKQQSKNNHFEKIKFQNSKVLLMVFMIILSIVGLFSLLTPLTQPNKITDIGMDSQSGINHNSNLNEIQHYIS